MQNTFLIMIQTLKQWDREINLITKYKNKNQMARKTTRKIKWQNGKSLYKFYNKWSVQSLSRVRLFVTPGTATRQASLSFTISWSLLKLMSIESVMPSTHLVLCYPFLLLPSVFLPSGSFLMSQVFAAGGQNIGASASVSVVPMNIQGWFPLRFTGLISLQSKGLSRVFSSTTIWKHQFFGAQSSLQSNSYIHTWLLEKP